MDVLCILREGQRERERERVGVHIFHEPPFLLIGVQEQLRPPWLFFYVSTVGIYVNFGKGFVSSMYWSMWPSVLAVRDSVGTCVPLLEMCSSSLLAVTGT